jgi:hypothetical protein
MTSLLIFLCLCLLLVFTLKRRASCEARAWRGFASAYAFLSCIIAACIGLELAALAALAH